MENLLDNFNIERNIIFLKQFNIELNLIIENCGDINDTDINKAIQWAIIELSDIDVEYYDDYFLEIKDEPNEEIYAHLMVNLDGVVYREGLSSTVIREL